MGNFISNSFNVDSDKKGTVYPVHIIIIYWWQLTVWDWIGFGLPLIHTFIPFLYTYAVSIKKFDNQFGFGYTLFHESDDMRMFQSEWNLNQCILFWNEYTLDQSYRNRFRKSSENTLLCRTVIHCRMQTLQLCHSIAFIRVWSKFCE